jgi:hypothetical protein
VLFWDILPCGSRAHFHKPGRALPAGEYSDLWASLQCFLKPSLRSLCTVVPGPCDCKVLLRNIQDIWKQLVGYVKTEVVSRYLVSPRQLFVVLNQVPHFQGFRGLSGLVKDLSRRSLTCTGLSPPLCKTGGWTSAAARTWLTGGRASHKLGGQPGLCSCSPGLDTGHSRCPLACESRLLTHHTAGNGRCQRDVGAGSGFVLQPPGLVSHCACHCSRC